MERQPVGDQERLLFQLLILQLMSPTRSRSCSTVHWHQDRSFIVPVSVPVGCKSLDCRMALQLSGVEALTLQTAFWRNRELPVQTLPSKSELGPSGQGRGSLKKFSKYLPTILTLTTSVHKRIVSLWLWDRTDPSVRSVFMIWWLNNQSRFHRMPNRSP